MIFIFLIKMHALFRALSVRKIIVSQQRECVFCTQLPAAYFLFYKLPRFFLITHKKPENYAAGLTQISKIMYNNIY